VTVEYVEFLVEEPSMEAVLRTLLPAMLGRIHFEVFAHQSKAELLQRLPARLAGYYRRRARNAWLRDRARVVVIVDRDTDDCRDLKQRIEAMAVHAGVATTGPHRPLVIRIAVEETEAWYFGDWAAVCASYPGVPRDVPGKARFRDPDAIVGGTWEAFERILQRAGYFTGGLRKVEVARTVAARMDPGINTSRSFQVFWQAVGALVSA
jgi:hypothetical protein